MRYNPRVILNIYKEKNWTSFDVVAKIRVGLGKKRKVGHAGTLDPLAEGVLIVLTDEDTKKQSEFMSLEKEYMTKIAFGVTTPMYDMEVLPDVSKIQLSLEEVRGKLKEILSKYIGEIDQKVPGYSAVKVGGKTLYKEARKGRISEVIIPVKRIKIHDIRVLGSKVEGVQTTHGKLDFPVIELRVRCSSGTYIRSLAHDLGVEIGCGAVMTKLVRTRIGDFVIEESMTVSDYLNSTH
jgi:tRNA pseudouridine55 synthase